MYDNVVYMGKTLKEWCDLLANEYTRGELYRMSKDNVHFNYINKQLSEN